MQVSHKVIIYIVFQTIYVRCVKISKEFTKVSLRAQLLFNAVFIFINNLL